MSTYSPSIRQVEAFRAEHGVGLVEAHKFLLKLNMLEALPTADLNELRDIVGILIKETM